MGCKSSKQLDGDGGKPGQRISSSSSPAPVEQHKRPTGNMAQQGASSRDKLRIDALQAETMCKEWLKTFKIKDGGEAVTLDMALKDTLSLLRTWPRGDAAGQLLPMAQKSNVPLKERGVKVSWLLGAWQHMTASTQRHLISTRMFVELLVRPLLRIDGGDETTLFDFIPAQYRAEPRVFVSHAWDGYFRHLLFYPENVKKNWPADSALWMDFVACPLIDEGPNEDRLDEIKETIQAAGRTVVVFPGDGQPDFAILPAHRSWCVFEMLNTPKDCLDFRVGLHGDLNDVEFHTQVVDLIDSLTLEKAQASYASDKRVIEACLIKLLDRSEVASSQLRNLTRSAFAKRYEAVPTTPSINNRISNGSKASGRGRINSMSDIYALQDEVKLDEGKAPDF